MLRDKMRLPFLAHFLFEICGIIQQERHSMFTKTGFMVFKVVCLISSALMTVSSLTFFVLEWGNSEKIAQRLRALVMGTTMIQLSMNHAYYMYKLKEIKTILKITDDLYDELSNEDKQEIDYSEKRCRNFVYLFAGSVFINLPPRLVEAYRRSTYATGMDLCPFDMHCFGIPIPWCASIQFVYMGVCTLVLVSNYCTLKVLVILLTAYCKALSSMIKGRCDGTDRKRDEKILKLYGIICSAATLLNDVYGATSVLEIAASSPRGCFSAYHLIVAVTRNDFRNVPSICVTLVTCVVLTYIICSCGEEIIEMKRIIHLGILESQWYSQTPSARKPLIQILSMNNNDLTLHFRKFIQFDMNMAGLVLQRAYSLMTMLANLV